MVGFGFRQTTLLRTDPDQQHGEKNSLSAILSVKVHCKHIILLSRTEWEIVLDQTDGLKNVDLDKVSLKFLYVYHHTESCN